MGWCAAFGPQICDGCDHAMVAGHDACSCSECCTTCLGLFPGCAQVWAAGPRPVALTRRSPQAGNLLPLAATTVVPVAGAVAREVAGAVASSAPEAALAPVAPSDHMGEDPDVKALRVDMQLLLRKVDRLQREGEPTEQITAQMAEQMLRAAREIEAVVSALPRQVRESVASALNRQRQETVTMFADLERKLRADIGQLQAEALQAWPPSEGPAPSVADLDERFEWLVEATSQRFVTLGNGLARIERALSKDPGRDGATNGGGATNGTARPVAPEAAVGAVRAAPANDQAGP